MADNVTLPGTGAAVASDDIAGAQYQRIKLIHGADGVNAGDVSTANPLPVVDAAGNVLTGAVDEAAPGDDTASAGTNGRLQRVAQNVTAGNAILATIDTAVDAANVTLTALDAAVDAMSVKLPAALGIQTAAASLSVAPASDASFALTSTGYRSAIVTTRPANVTPYTAGDVVGGAIAFTTIGPSAGHIIITSVDLRYDVAAIPAGMTSFRLHLYTVTPPSATADNAAWDLPAGDREAYIGYIDIGSPADVGSTLFVQLDGLNKQAKLATAETSLYGYLVTNGGYTPAANSETFRASLRALAI